MHSRTCMASIIKIACTQNWAISAGRSFRGQISTSAASKAGPASSSAAANPSKTKPEVPLTTGTSRSRQGYPHHWAAHDDLCRVCFEPTAKLQDVAKHGSQANSHVGRLCNLRPGQCDCPFIKRDSVHDGFGNPSGCANVLNHDANIQRQSRRRRHLAPGQCLDELLFTTLGILDLTGCNGNARTPTPWSSPRLHPACCLQSR